MPQISTSILYWCQLKYSHWNFISNGSLNSPINDIPPSVRQHISLVRNSHIMRMKKIYFINNLVSVLALFETNKVMRWNHRLNPVVFMGFSRHFSLFMICAFRIVEAVDWNTEFPLFKCWAWTLLLVFLFCCDRKYTQIYFVNVTNQTNSAPWIDAIRFASYSQYFRRSTHFRLAQIALGRFHDCLSLPWISWRSLFRIVNWFESV